MLNVVILSAHIIDELLIVFELSNNPQEKSQLCCGISFWSRNVHVNVCVRIFKIYKHAIKKNIFELFLLFHSVYIFLLHCTYNVHCFIQKLYEKFYHCKLLPRFFTEIDVARNWYFIMNEYTEFGEIQR